MPDGFSLKGRHIFMMAAKGDFYLAIAMGCLRNGAYCTIAGNSFVIDDELTKLMEEFPNRINYMFIDDVQKKSPIDLIHSQYSKFGPVSVFVNYFSLGISEFKKPESIQAFEANFTNVVKTIVHQTQKMITYMLATNTRGVIINLTGIFEKIASSMIFHREAAASSILSYSQSLAAMPKHRNIRINCVEWRSGFNSAYEIYESKPESNAAEVQIYKRYSSTERLRKIVEATVFLASDEASYVTGRTLSV
jgi:NAD(P)-dependent dehydrogenase (short-subunit alcohol dehydrogenase family)